MEVSQLKDHFPWKTTSSDMRWNVLLMCKLLFILLLLNGFWSKIDDPYLPFLLVLDHLNEWPGAFALFNKTLLLTSGLLLLFNFRARLMAGILGGTILLILLGSKPIFRNHILICGCAFLLAALHKKEETPYLLYFQLGLVYIGAAMNKMFQIDWWNGVYMHNWMVNVLENGPYLWVNQNFKNLYFAIGLSWFSMFLEIIVGLFLFFKGYRRWAIFLILFFHLILFSVTKERFGHFLDDILIFLIAFINKVPLSQSVSVKASWNTFLKSLIRLVDWDGNFKVVAKTNGASLIQVQGPTKKLVNLEAIKHILFSSAGFFYLLFFIDLALRFILNQPTQHMVQLLVYWGLFFLFARQWNNTAKESTYSYQN